METKRTVSQSMTMVKTDTNLDPLTGTPGAHPVGVGTGAAGGGATGAVIGAMVAGPIGAAVGAAAGALVGGVAGKVTAEAINPTTEHAYWRSEFVKRPYVTIDSPYDQYGPAYQYGWESYAAHGAKAKAFDEVEPELRRAWDNRRGNSKLSWEQAQAATRDAWQRVEKAASGHCCG